MGGKTEGSGLIPKKSGKSFGCTTHEKTTNDGGGRQVKTVQMLEKHPQREGPCRKGLGGGTSTGKAEKADSVLGGKAQEKENWEKSGRTSSFKDQKRRKKILHQDWKNSTILGGGGLSGGSRPSPKNLMRGGAKDQVPGGYSSRSSGAIRRECSKEAIKDPREERRLRPGGEIFEI